MPIDNLCPPALLYLAFSLIQILVDTYKQLYSTAFIKFLIMILFTTILNTFCASGLSVISWLLVFVPFITMTIITSFLLFMLGVQQNKMNYSVEYPNKHNYNKSKNNDNNLRPHRFIYVNP
jgi:hypothetical protein